MTGGGKGAPGEGRGGWCHANDVWEHGPLTNAFGVVMPPPGAARLMAERPKFVYGAIASGFVNGPADVGAAVGPVADTHRT